MKKNSIARAALLLLMVVCFIAACRSGHKKAAATEHRHAAVQQYTCPMHPQVVKDGPGTCPVCGMDLVLTTATPGAVPVDSNVSHQSKPVNEQVMAGIPTIMPESGTRIHSIVVQGSVTYDSRRQTSIASRVSGRIERLYIRSNYQPVQKGQLIMELYSPDLAAAQQELLFLSRTPGNAALLEKAKQRLGLLGMRPKEIRQVLQTGKIMYHVPVYSNVAGYILERQAGSLPASSVTPALPASGSGGMDNMEGSTGAGITPPGSAGSLQAAVQNQPVLVREGQYVNAGQSLFTVYDHSALVAEFSFDPSLAARLKKGQQLVYRATSDPQTVYSGSIGLIQPVLRPGGNFTIARVYLGKPSLRAGQLLTANVPFVNKGWWLPRNAVLQTGSKAIVFKKEGGVFLPRNIRPGLTVNGMVLTTDSIGGWEIAKSASYLVDSESFIPVYSATQKALQ